MFRKMMLPLIFLSLISLPARSDMFGADVAVLGQILANAVQQLYQLKQMVQSGEDSLDLMRDINRGINDSLELVDSISPFLDPGLYKDLRKLTDVIRHINTIYGEVARSPDAQVQRDTDSVVAESITMNNELYDYTKQLDQIAERIKSFSHDASPGGATKLTAQSLAVVVQALNQQMRAQGQIMKLQAQGLAVQNKREKDQTRNYLDQTNVLRNAMKQNQPTFEFPRF